MNNDNLNHKPVSPTATESNKSAVSPRFLKVPTPTSPPSPALPPLVQPLAIQIPVDQFSNQSEIYGFGTKKGGKGGKPGMFNVVEGCDESQKTPPSPVSSVASQVKTAEFIAALFHTLPPDAYVAVCSKPGDPTTGSWLAKRADQVISKLPANHNNYFNISSFYLADDKSIHTKKEHFAALHVLMFDDIGTKIPFDKLNGFKLSYLIETSPGNYQGGIILKHPLLDADSVIRLLNAVIAAGLTDPGANGQCRWARSPNAINGKAKYASVDGLAFQCRLFQWNPELVYTVEEIVIGLNLELMPAVASRASAPTNIQIYDYEADDDVITHKPSENPVIAAFKNRGLYKTPLGSGKHLVTCPWCHEHTDQLDNGAAYIEPSEEYPVGGYRCQHSHGDRYKTKQLFEFLGIQKEEAKCKPTIRLVPGELDRINNAAEKELAKNHNYYQSGDLIVTIVTNLDNGDTRVVPINASTLTKVLSKCAAWERYNDSKKVYVPCDPSPRVISLLIDSQTYFHLPYLKGIARQPYFRENDGHLVNEAGYDSVSQCFGVFDARKFVTPEPTLEAAINALAMLNGLLDEFSFTNSHDKSAALSAILTAATRTSYPYAPAFHAKASTYGSGKSYLNELISAFAKPGLTQKVSYPIKTEEATKSILSLLISAPAVIEFDDMATDWIPHGIINRMLTAESITDRILGVSKTATVSTRTLFLSSGNNVGPVRDLLRRVITINIDHRCATPATKSYTGSPVEEVRKDRGRYVAAALTIILAWKAAGSPHASVENIATYGGAWADYCRHTLIWLGLPDPATSLLEQVKHDPDTDALLALMTAWHNQFGSSPTTIRKVIETAFSTHNDNLIEAIYEFPMKERDGINNTKFGWLLKNNVNRIFGEYTLRRGSADGRVAWFVEKV